VPSGGGGGGAAAASGGPSAAAEGAPEEEKKEEEPAEESDEDVTLPMNLLIHVDGFRIVRLELLGCADSRYGSHIVKSIIDILYPLSVLAITEKYRAHRHKGLQLCLNQRHSGILGGSDLFPIAEDNLLTFICP
jgi:hypothetical protein